MSRLHPCPSCARHLRAGETACPFCGAVLSGTFGASAPIAPSNGRPMSRAALLFAAATVAASCGGAIESTGAPDGGHDAARSADGGDDPDALPVTLYGPGPVNEDAGRAQDAGTDSAGEYDGGMPVMYGPAPINDGG
jgi:hypothetical protein